MKSFSNHPMANHPGHAKKRGVPFCVCGHRKTSHSFLDAPGCCFGSARHDRAQRCECRGFEPKVKK